LILYRTAEALFVKHEDHAYPLEESSLVVNSSQGGGSKDTWVLE